MTDAVQGPAGDDSARGISAADGSAGGASAADSSARDGAATAAASAAALPRVLADTGDLAARSGDPDERGAVWRLSEPARHLDANVIALPPGGTIDAHVGPDEDVLWHVLAGGGTLTTDADDVALTPGELVWLPRRSHRAVTAGPEGLRYLTVHRRKSGLQIGSRPGSTGDECA